MELTDLCPLETWENLEKELFEKFNFQGSVFTPDGVRITDAKNFNNQLCPAIKANEKGQTFICSAAHMNMTAMAKKQRTAVVEECDAGLIKLVVPIFFEDAFLGVAGGCGLLTEDNDVDTFAVTKLAAMDEALVTDLAGSVPRISSDLIPTVSTFIQDRLTQILASCDQKK